MELKPPLFILILLPLLLTYTTSSSSLTPLSLQHISPTKSPSPSKSPTPTSAQSTLDPKQLTALQSLNIPTLKDPCTQPSFHNATLCDTAKPFRHLLSLRLTNCSDDLELSTTALKSLSTLQDLQFINCPISPVHFPSDLTSNLHTFTCINSLKRLTGVWLGRLGNVTDLVVANVFVNASGPFVILGNMKKLRSVTISRTNLTGHFPKKWNLNIIHIDLSGNRIKGNVHTSFTLLENLEFLNLSSNALSGEIPYTFGDLLSLKNVSFASNSMSGAIPDTVSEIPGLVHLDLSSNQFNGTIPKSISGMKNLRYLNLENNNFNGVMPFNVSFIKRLSVFKVGENSNLCYNHSKISSKVKLGIAPCDKYGLPVSLPPAKESGFDDNGGSNEDETTDDDSSTHKDSNKHGPSKIVLGVAIGLSSIVFVIVFLVLLSKWCK
ncbi:hypothetical protein GIB67_001480 [Kingdonia uniflora]|uniref:Receptor-like protein 51 n=2 Tax=Kingdonia uniflora TaxID=39325 RepID=A0A7J7MNP2_9MAGN|nr:hypothetical protein GIB67_001480 [Kingdonia uniflora]